MRPRIARAAAHLSLRGAAHPSLRRAKVALTMQLTQLRPQSCTCGLRVHMWAAASLLCVFQRRICSSIFWCPAAGRKEPQFGRHRMSTTRIQDMPAVQGTTPCACCRILLCSLQLRLCARSCVAAISTVVISGDWQGTVLFYDWETRSELVRLEHSHAGGVSAVTAFALNEEEFCAGLCKLIARIRH